MPSVVKLRLKGFHLNLTSKVLVYRLRNDYNPILFLLAANPCNCGTCDNLPGSYRCNCDQWTTGVHCENDVDECQNQSLCSKNIKQGICRNEIVTTNCHAPGRKGYECYCKIGFQGNFILLCVGSKKGCIPSLSPVLISACHARNRNAT